jgi:hypothetical protein
VVIAMNKIVRGLFAAFVIVTVGTHSLATESTSSNNDLVLIKEGIQNVRSEPEPTVRERSAATLVRDIQRIDRTSIEDATIDELIGLLNDDSDAVRYRIAMAIAAIGPRAKRAAPALENAFELAKQYILYIQHRNFIFSGFDYYTGTSSTDPICYALHEIGAPSPPGCVDGHFEDTGTTVTFR